MEYLGCQVETETPSQTAETNNRLERFMTFGGYPEIAKTPQVTSGYLSALYDAIIMKDIVRRYKVRKVEELYNVADWLILNFTNPFSATSLADELGMSSSSLPDRTTPGSEAPMRTQTGSQGSTSPRIRTSKI